MTHPGRHYWPRLFFRPLFRFCLMDLFVDAEARLTLIYAVGLITASVLLSLRVQRWGWADAI